MAKTTRAAKAAKPAQQAAPINTGAPSTDAPPMLPEVRFGAYRVTSGNALIYGFGPSAFDMTPALKKAGAPTDRPHLIGVAERLAKSKAMAISRQQLTDRSMTTLRIAIGEMQAQQLPLS